MYGYTEVVGFYGCILPKFKSIILARNLVHQTGCLKLLHRGGNGIYYHLSSVYRSPIYH